LVKAHLSSIKTTRRVCDIKLLLKNVHRFLNLSGILDCFLVPENSLTTVWGATDFVVITRSVTCIKMLNLKVVSVQHYNKKHLKSGLLTDFMQHLKA
jgi:hypothetical protein